MIVSCISARGLTKSYGGTNVVDGIDITVKPGSIFGFLGPNGAGKSTTIKMLTTLIRPDGGSLEILGHDAARFPLLVRKRIGVVLQRPSYEPTLTVIRSLEKYGMMWDVPARECKARAARLLEDFDLTGIRDKRNDDLSIGQRRRVQVAREFMHDMDILFLDEPTIGLDPAARRALLDYLRARTAEGLAILYTTHVLTEAEYLCDEIAVINQGRIIAVDTPEELKSRFGREKTIRIRIATREEGVPDMLKDIADCTVDLGSGTDITVRSADAGRVLPQILSALERNNIVMEDLVAAPASLEDVFLRMVGDPCTR